MGFSVEQRDISHDQRKHMSSERGIERNRETKRETEKMKVTVFYNLIVDVTFHHSVIFYSLNATH